MPKIRFLKNDKLIECNKGANLMRALLDAGIPVASSCNGEGICKKCRVTIANSQGEQESLTDYERFALETGELKTNQRLACQVDVNCDITVDTTYW